MALSIHSNINSLSAQRMLGSSQSAMSTALQRLSSGTRINSAKDDAAGLAISDRMTSQVRGLNQAARNTNDAISLLQTAEGAMVGVTDKLQRIRELAVQAANDSNSASDRHALQAEVNQLATEIDRISASTEFNGMKVFDSVNFSAVGDETLLAMQDGLTNAGSWLENSETMIRDLYGIQGDGAGLSIQYTTFTDGVGQVAAQVGYTGADAFGRGLNLTLQVDLADFVPPNLPDGGNAPFYNDRIVAHEMVHAVMARTTNWQDITSNHLWFAEGSAEFIHGADERVKADMGSLGSNAAVSAAILGPSNTSPFYSASYAAVRYVHTQIKAAGGDGIKDLMSYMASNPGATLDQAFANASHGLYANAAAARTDFINHSAAFIGTFDLNNADTGGIGGADVDGQTTRSATSTVPNTGGRTGPDVMDGFTEAFEHIATTGGSTKNLKFQVGANAHQTIDTRIGAVNLKAMALSSALDVTKSPSQVMVAVDRALSYVNSQRANLGAQMSRMDTTVSNLQQAAENLSASRGRIQDADFAVETANLSRAQILQQAGTAMVAQANQLPKGVLALLG
jgi:flagellin